MCGIVGMVRGRDRAVDSELLRRMCDAITHRGPDDDGYYLGARAGLAMRRLAIIDLAHGQ